MALVCADTSFLFSLFGNDSNTAAAQRWTRGAGAPIAVTVIGRYAFGNALRFAAFRRAISRADALASLAAFESDLQSGYLQLVPCDLAAIVIEAIRLSELHTLSGGHRSFDVLHVATAKVLKASNFLSFDANQRKLAAAAQIAVAP